MKALLKFIPLTIILLLFGIVIAVPNIFEFEFGSKPTPVPTGQYLISEAWMWVYIIYTMIVIFYSLIFIIDDSDDSVGVFVLNMQVLETLKGNYYYKIDDEDNIVRIYELQYSNFKELKKYNFSLYKNITTADITKNLDTIARQIEESKYSYIKEELSTWKRFK